MKNTYKDAAMEFSRCARTERPPCLEQPASRDGLSKLNSVFHVEVNVFLGEPRIRTSKLITGWATYRSKSSGFPRKEVIQPQLPLLLPCYYFTPITDPTFDGSLPNGLGHRLRVLPAFVV
jgi:hypothetical protein